MKAIGQKQSKTKRRKKFTCFNLFTVQHRSKQQPVDHAITALTHENRYAKIVRVSSTRWEVKSQIGS